MSPPVSVPAAETVPALSTIAVALALDVVIDAPTIKFPDVVESDIVEDLGLVICLHRDCWLLSVDRVSTRASRCNTCRCNACFIGVVSKVSRAITNNIINARGARDTTCIKGSSSAAA